MKVSIVEIRKKLQEMNLYYGKDYEIYEQKGGLVNEYGYRYARDIRITSREIGDIELLRQLPQFRGLILKDSQIYREYESDRYMIRVFN